MLQRIASSLDSFFGRALTDTPVFISFDVEALLIRAPDNHVDRLIWGKTATGEYGIRRLSSILLQHKLRGNFLIDLAACSIYGDEKVREVVDFLLSEGHEVHAHMHPEMLADSWKLERTGVRGRRFDDQDRFMTFSLLTFAARKIKEFTQRDPFMFRSGSYLFNRHTVDGAKRTGFAALSNYNARRHASLLGGETPAKAMEPFCWDNGVFEMPVDISSPEKLSWSEFRRRWSQAQHAKESQTFNLVSHSWTLLKRDENGHFMEFDPQLEERFHTICEGLSGSARVLGYEEYFRGNPPKTVVDGSALPTVAHFSIKRAFRCRNCLAIISLDVLSGNVCKSCGSPEIFAFDSASHRRAYLEKTRRRVAAKNPEQSC